MSSQKSYYEILGVGEQAGVDDVRAAFRKLARERHPDRFQGSLKREAEREFQAITEAYNVLIDPDRRARYDQSRQVAGRDASASPKELAKAMLAKAVGLMKSGELERAAELFTQSIAHDPQNAKGRHLYGMFLAQHTNRLDEALRQLDQAVKLDSLNARVLLDASRLFARAKMVNRALRLAESAAELSADDPAVESWLQQLRQGLK
ncbi:MAG: DnaJ domain-containing protein [Acidobacteriota bacterium]